MHRLKKARSKKNMPGPKNKDQIVWSGKNKLELKKSSVWLAKCSKCIGSVERAVPLVFKKKMFFFSILKFFFAIFSLVDRLVRPAGCKFRTAFHSQAR